MRVREAKNFLVDRIKRQAVLEEVPLSDVEIDMLYFTERGGIPEKLQKAAEEFDRSYDMAEYEKKISRLMKHAYAEIKKQDPAAKAMWESAIHCLRKGDHYILVMWGNNSFLWGICVAVGILLVYAMLIFLFRWFQHTFAPPNPHTLLGVFLALIAIGLLFPRPLGKALGWIFDQTIGRIIGPNDNEEEEA